MPPDRLLLQNGKALLHEIRHGLARLLERGETTSIDLLGIPLAPAEEAWLIDELGSGEVQAQLSAMGPSEIIETGFSGVWLVTHFNGAHEVIAKFIEVCFVPQLLQAQAQDIRQGLVHLTDRLAEPGHIMGTEETTHVE
jgi:hydrogenase-1 operon protein HyaF